MRLNSGRRPRPPQKWVGISDRLRRPCRKYEMAGAVAARLRVSGARVSDTDGVRVLTDGGWRLLRSSNTQAVLVARCEASSDAGRDRLKAALVAQLDASGLAAPDFSGENAGH